MKLKWLAEFEKYGADTVKREQKSPAVLINDWYIAAEHQRNYRSLILRDKRGEIPRQLSHPKLSPLSESDEDKGWHYRIYLSPEEFEELVQNHLLK